MNDLAIQISLNAQGQIQLTAPDGANLLVLLGMLDFAREILLTKTRGQQGPKASPLLMARGVLPSGNGNVGKG